MKMRILVFVLLLIQSPLLFAQAGNFLTLDSCYRLALKHQPVSRQAGLYTQMNVLQIESVNTQYLPKINLNGQASWQTDVTELPINIPNIVIPSIDKDSYKINLDVNQLIWDGGAGKHQKELEAVMLQLNLGNVEIENQKTKEMVNQVYFNILMANESEKLLKVAMDEIGSRLARVRAGIENGVVLPSNGDVLDAEMIKTEQALAEVVHSRAAAIYRLGELTGLALGPEVVLQEPETAELPPPDTRLRPEYRLFLSQQQQLGVRQKMTNIKVMPQISAFGMAGYGKPGLNMLSNQFDTYAMFGARFNWTVFDWNQHKKEREILGLQQQVIETQKETYEQNLRILLNNIRQDILRLETLIAADHRIVGLRQSVVLATAAQLDQGLITSSEYLTEQNAHTQAQLNLKLHTIQLQLARINYSTKMGYLN